MVFVQPSVRPLCFTYQSTNCHLTHPQILLNMHSHILQTTIKEAHAHSYLLSASIPRVPRRSVPLWCPSCLCLCECCWWNLPSSGDGSPASLSVVSEQQNANQTRAWLWRCPLIGNMQNNPVPDCFFVLFFDYWFYSLPLNQVNIELHITC